MPHPSQRPEEDLVVNESYRILYQDAYFMAVEKPSPLPVHKVGRFVNKNLLSLLIRDGYGADLSVVNRLDSETSGIVILARSSEVAGDLGTQFQNRQVEKKYQAVAFGNLSEKKAILVCPLAQSLIVAIIFASRMLKASLQKHAMKC